MTTPNKETSLVKKPETKPSALNIMASRMSVEPAKLFETLKATVFKTATNEELLALTVVANEYDLNPFLKEIYAFPAKGGGIMPIVSVDGWNKMLLRQPDYDGKKFTFEYGENGILISCTATIFVKNRSHPEEVTEFFDECVRNTDNWKNMPKRMLRNRTLCQASRMAFGFSGIYHEDEAFDIEAIVSSDPPAPLKQITEATPKVVPPAAGKSVQDELETLLVTAGFTYDQLAKWGEREGVIPDASSFSNFGELPTDVCRRLLRAQAGLLKGLETATKA